MAQLLVLLWGFVDGLPLGSKCLASHYSIEESKEEALFYYLLLLQGKRREREELTNHMGKAKRANTIALVRDP